MLIDTHEHDIFTDKGIFLHENTVHEDGSVLAWKFTLSKVEKFFSGRRVWSERGKFNWDIFRVENTVDHDDLIRADKSNFVFGNETWR